MDIRQIEEKSKALQKADKAGETPSVLVRLLTDLKGIKATEDILRSTRIGVIVNRFKQNKNGEVASLANELVRKWRDEVEKEKGNKGPNGSKKTSSQGGGATPQPGKSSPAPAAKVSTETSVAPDKRTWKADKVEINRTGNKARDACVGLMYDGLVHLSTATPNAVLQMALSVEEAVYKKFQPETSAVYKDKIRMLFQNLKNKTNPDLRIKVMRGEIKPDYLVNASHEDLKSDKMKAEEDKIKQENLREAQVAIKKGAISDEFVCGKCRQKKVSYTQAQTRSADEPMTTFCTCENCGHRWKFS